MEGALYHDIRTDMEINTIGLDGQFNKCIADIRDRGQLVLMHLSRKSNLEAAPFMERKKKMTPGRTRVVQSRQARILNLLTWWCIEVVELRSNPHELRANGVRTLEKLK